MASNRQRIPGLNYVILDGADTGRPFPLIGFNMRPFSIPEITQVGRFLPKGGKKHQKTILAKIHFCHFLPNWQKKICFIYSDLGNCRSLDEFKILNTIASGKFGTVYKVRDSKSNKIYALKKLDIPVDEYNQPQGVIPQHYLRMISNMKKLNDGNVVRLHDVVVETNFDCNSLLLDYCPFSLEDIIGQVSPVYFQHPHIKTIMRQMLSGLQCIHRFNIIHRDLSPKNILFTEDGVLKIADMASSRTASDGDMTPAHGLRWYRPPEILFGSLKYTKAVDMWAVGCIFGEMLLQRPLLCAESDGDVVRAMIDLFGSPSEKHWPGFSKLPVPRLYYLRKQPYSRIRIVFHNQTIATVNYLQKFLQYNPASRPRVEDVMEDFYYVEYPRCCNYENIVFLLKTVKMQ